MSQYTDRPEGDGPGDHGPGDDGPAPDRDGSRAARRRVLTTALTALVLYVVIMVVNDRVDVFGDHSPHHHRSAGQIWSDVAGVVVGVVVTAGVLLLAWRLLPRSARAAWSAPWTVSGSHRRRMDRAIRRGRPSGDPALAEVEYARAARAHRLRWAGRLMFGVFAAGAVALTVTADTGRATVYYAVIAGGFTGALVYSIVYTRGARRYLQAADRRDHSA